MGALKNIVMSGLLGAVGNELDYKIELQAAAWRDKDVIDDNDLQSIITAIENKNAENEVIENE